MASAAALKQIMTKQFQHILVTGAEGFIGSHLVEALVAQGRTVRAMSLYNSFGHHGWLDSIPPHRLKGVELVMGDVRDPHSVRHAMRDCDAVLHLAALIAIPYSYSAPASYVDTNVTGTLNVVQAARDLGVSKVVHTSTSEVYGSAQVVPISESHPLVGQSPYSASKIGADQMAHSYYCAFWYTCGYCTSVQHLWPTAKSARRAAHHHVASTQRCTFLAPGAPCAQRAISTSSKIRWLD
jgi:nucleoside-diphosphate-sugar epimerase